MKNIHLIPTDKPSNFHKFGDCFDINAHLQKWHGNAKPEYFNIYITSDEEIKEDWCIEYDDIDKKWLTPYKPTNKSWDMVSKANYCRLRGTVKKIILTDNEDLIKDGVQAIDAEFLEWFVKNHSCENVEIFAQNVYSMGKWDTRHSIIIPKEEPKQFEDEFDMQSRIINKVWDEEEPKQETLEEATERLIPKTISSQQGKAIYKTGFEDAIKWQAERMNLNKKH